MAHGCSGEVRRAEADSHLRAELPRGGVFSPLQSPPPPLLEGLHSDRPATLHKALYSPVPWFPHLPGARAGPEWGFPCRCGLRGNCLSDRSRRPHPGTGVQRRAPPPRPPLHPTPQGNECTLRLVAGSPGARPTSQSRSLWSGRSPGSQSAQDPRSRPPALGPVCVASRHLLLLGCVQQGEKC